GEAAKNIPGLANNPDVDTVSPDTGTWSGATASQILGDIRKMENDIVADSMGVERPDTTLVTVTQFGYLSAPLGDNADKTVLDWIRTKLLYVKDIVRCWQLEQANAGRNGGRIIMYSKDETKLVGLLPIEFGSFPPQQ